MVVLFSWVVTPWTGTPVSRARREGEGDVAGGVFLWGRWQSGKVPPTRRLAGPAERPRPSGKRGSGRLERKKRMGRGWDERPDGPKAEENYFRIKFGFLKIQRLWKFVQGDSGGILTWGFFLNSPMLLKDFRKMKYAMPCYATLGKIN
jgi:hypothetical protein